MTPECHWETGQIGETLASYKDQLRQPSVHLHHFTTGFGPHTPLYLVALSKACEPNDYSLGYLPYTYLDEFHSNGSCQKRLGTSCLGFVYSLLFLMGILSLRRAPRKETHDCQLSPKGWYQRTTIS